MMLLLALVLLGTAPDTLRLEACYRKAEANYPLRRGLALQASIAEHRVENLKAQYLPALSLGGQAVYHSEVPEFPLSLPGAEAPVIERDQYRLSLSVDQLIYDGGLVQQQQEVEYVQRDLAQQEIEVELYGLRQRVNAAFFGALLRQAQLASLQALEADLRARLSLVRSQVSAGSALGSSADVLAAELIRVEQQQAEVEANRRAALGVLGELIGRPVGAEAMLELPEAVMDSAAAETRGRPEYEVFTLTRERLARQESLAARRNQPRVSSFAEAAYGRPPGLNLFENDFRPFVSVGLRVRWPFWDGQVARRERAVLALERQIVDAREETFARNIDVAVAQELQDIRRLEELLRRDDEIIELRQRVAARAASQLENGVITATDYLIERNAEYQARLARDVHRIQLVQARVAYLTTIGER